MVVTKADVYEQMIFAERPVCPYCGQEMSIWECEETGFCCGVGWDTPYLFVCFNDECPAFVEGWESMKRLYARRCSYRCIYLPGARNTEMMLVYSSVYGKSEIIDEAVIAVDRARGTPEDPAVQELLQCFASRDVSGLLSSLFDDRVYYKVRLKAAELIGELGMLEAIEPLHNHKFYDERVVIRVRAAIERIHEINRTQECPYCTEVIEAGAALCSQCGREIC
ncbi:MAG: zinc ribbon domain-containing protein [Thermodesulfobacteriota bacterium]